MKRSLKLLFGIFCALALAAVAYFGAMGMMDSLSTYRSPLKDAPPTSAGVPAGQALTRRVVFVLVDALRYDTAMDAQVMPVLASLRAQGASATLHSRPPSYSQPGYSTLLTGAWSEINDGPAMNVEKADIWAISQETLYSVAHRAGLTTALSGYDWFERLLPQGDVSLSFYTPGEDATADRAVLDAALPWLRENSAQLVLIHIDQVDYAGHHEGGADSPAWKAAASRADALIGDILATLDLTQDTILVVSDHGQIDRGGHGGHEMVALTEPFVLAGAGVVPGEYGDAQQVDVTPTLAALLGIDLPATAQGRVLTELLALDASQRADLRAEQNAGQGALLVAYRAALDPQNRFTPRILDDPIAAMTGLRVERLRAERLPRALWVGALLALLVFVALRGWNRDRLWQLGGALLTLALFCLRLYLIDRRGFSLSAIDGVMWLVTYVFSVMLLSMLIAAALAGWRAGAYQRAPLETARFLLGFTLMTLAVLLLPVLWHLYYNGPAITWTQPNVPSATLSLFAQVMIIAAAVCGLLLAGIGAAGMALRSAISRRRESATIPQRVHD